MPRTSIKGQVLVDLVVEFAEPPVEIVAEQRNMDEKSVGVISTPRSPCWRVYVDGIANQKGFGMGLVLKSPKKTIIEKSLRLEFSATNNEAEYEALLQGMAMVQKMGGKTVEMFSNSRLVVGQVNGELEARDARMQQYLSQVKRLQSDFDLFSLSHVSKSGNTHADRWPCLLPPRQVVCLGLFLLSFWIKQVRLQRARSICMKSKWVLAE